MKQRRNGEAAGKLPFLYQAAVYVRVSKEDRENKGDIQESNSIQNQRELIQEFLKGKQDIDAVSVRVDDGFSGLTYQRPAFLAMLSDIYAGKINCVLVKDLSRLGRNYVETGRYVEKIFPALGVRFIAVTDQIDSRDESYGRNRILIPFKNLMNDAYSRDLSVKIRSSLDVKRKKGEFIGAFAPYGYQKLPGDKHVLVPDPEAGGIVKRIFEWKLDGRSEASIAEALNRAETPSPLRYRQLCSLTCKNPLKPEKTALWTSAGVRRILKNETYTGMLVQKKQQTISYKVRKKKKLEEKDWIKVENTHEAIIGRETFELVGKLLSRDLRKEPEKEKIYPLAGVLYCKDCKSSMIRKTVPSGNKKYVYYICSKYKKEKSCKSHRIREEVVLKRAGEWLGKPEGIRQEDRRELIKTIDYILVSESGRLEARFRSIRQVKGNP